MENFNPSIITPENEALGNNSSVESMTEFFETITLQNEQLNASIKLKILENRRSMIKTENYLEWKAQLEIQEANEIELKRHTFFKIFEHKVLTRNDFPVVERLQLLNKAREIIPNKCYTAWISRLEFQQNQEEQAHGSQIGKYTSHYFVFHLHLF